MKSRFYRCLEKLNGFGLVIATKCVSNSSKLAGLNESILLIDYRVGACGSDMVGGGQEIIIVIAITIVQLVVTNADLDGA